MIEVNLLPGGKKRAPKRRRFSFSMPEIGGLPSDPWILGSAAVILVLLVASGFLYARMSGQVSEVEAQVEEAVADSARYADLIEQAERLRARRDSIAERVQIIQEIDRERYVWPHVLDEVARALPDYTWLTEVLQIDATDALEVRIRGRAGTNFALTTFMENLEASPFIRGVTLINTELVVQNARTLNRFALEAAYEEPPRELLETVPLFDGDEGAEPGNLSGEEPLAAVPSAGTR